MHARFYAHQYLSLSLSLFFENRRRYKSRDVNWKRKIGKITCCLAQRKCRKMAALGCLRWIFAYSRRCSEHPVSLVFRERANWSKTLANSCFIARCNHVNSSTRQYCVLIFVKMNESVATILVGEQSFYTEICPIDWKFSNTLLPNLYFISTYRFFISWLYRVTINVFILYMRWHWNTLPINNRYWYYKMYIFYTSKPFLTFLKSGNTFDYMSRLF